MAKKEKKRDPVADSIAAIRLAYRMGKQLNREFDRLESKLIKSGRTKYKAGIIGELATEHGINPDVVRKRKELAVSTPRKNCRNCSR